METVNVVIQDNNRMELQLSTNGQKAGEMEIAVADGKLTVYHTGVRPEYEGKGFAKLLLHELVEYARKNKLQIVPLCPYVQVQFKRRPEDYKDVFTPSL